MDLFDGFELAGFDEKFNGFCRVNFNGGVDLGLRAFRLYHIDPDTGRF